MNRNEVKWNEMKKNNNEIDGVSKKNKKMSMYSNNEKTEVYGVL